MLIDIRRVLCIAVLFIANTSASAETRTPQIAIVTDLYRSFAFEAVLEGSDFGGFIDQPREVLLRYFTPELAELLLRDRACARKTHEICRLDFLPLWGNQDPAGASVQIKSGTTGNVVNAHLYISGASTQVVFSLSKTALGWRIANVSYGKGRSSLKEILETKL